MLAQAAARLGYHLHVYEPAGGSPAGEVAAREYAHPWTDAARLAEFARGCAAVTYEFENVPVAPLHAIEGLTCLRPHWSVLETCQNRLREKTWLRRQGFPHAAFVAVGPEGDLAEAIRQVGYPCVVKTADFGYDGKGQIKVSDQASAAKAGTAFAGQGAVVEQWVSFQAELSVIVARGLGGEAVTYPVAENIHTQHILDFTIVPARFEPKVLEEARNLALAIAERLELVGLMAVEMFLGDDGRVLVNELAPRTHNSGHWTLDAGLTSQFEQQVRAIAGLPLGDTNPLAPAAVMVNILGDAWQTGEPAWAEILRHPQAHLHLYGKSEARPGRKMGHFTLTGTDAGAVLAEARQLKARLVGASV
jgi:5-(carboxyamino)imidazole ribonucleotide synthase